MRVRLHPEATAELIEAGDWYDAQLSGLGLDLAEEVGRALEAVSERPLAWPFWPGIDHAAGVRRFLLPKFPFALAYVLDGDDILILAVAHVRRRPGYWRDRATRR